MIPVVIVGGGPSGAAMAIALRNLDIACVVMDDGKTGLFKPGESLPPNASQALRQLNIVALLQSKEHAAYIGNTVVWGNDTPLSRYFLNEPLGNGWHLDRLFFEKQLRTEAEARGAIWIEKCRLSEIHYSEDKFVISCIDTTGTHNKMEAAFVVDSSGRASIVAKKLGIKKQIIDRLTAFCFILKQSPKTLSGISFIESVQDGYWYAAPINNQYIIVNYMTDGDLHTTSTSGLQQWLFDKIKNAHHLSSHLQISRLEQLEEIHVKTASTSFLEQAAGQQWIAVGDALCSYDPLTSFGITHALSSSYYAALAIQGYLNGNLENMSTYISIQQDTFNKCMTMLQAQYQIEKRWNASPFWERRHSNV